MPPAKQSPAIAGAWNALVFSAVAVAMHGDIATKPVGRIGKQFTDADVEHLRNLDQVRDGA